MAENQGEDKRKELSEPKNQSHISRIELHIGEITLRKECIRKGHGTVRPVEGSVCSVRLENVSSEEGDHVMQIGVKKIRIGEGDTDTGGIIDKCLCTTTEGEISTFVSVLKSKGSCANLENGIERCKIEGPNTRESKSGTIPSKLGANPSNSRPDSPKVEPDPSSCVPDPSKMERGPSNISLKIELISIDKHGHQTWQLSAKEKLARALSLKERGNSLYRLGSIHFAFSQYRKAIKVLISMLPESNIPEDSLTDFTQARCHCYLNLAACQVKSRKWDYVLENCTKVLEIQPDNVKALYRRGQAYQETEDFNAAKSDLQQCLKLEPQNKSVLIALREIALKVKEKSDSAIDELK